METELFEDIDDDDKSLFVGNFFMWVKKEFKAGQKKKQDLTLVKSDQKGKNDKKDKNKVTSD